MRVSLLRSFQIKKKAQITAPNRNVNTYLNFAETRAEKQWLASEIASRVTFLLAHVDSLSKARITSRTIIRAAWLHRLPGVHLPSSHQVLFLGS